jgi:hypothetical protein
MTALLPSIQRYHDHPATATPQATPPPRTHRPPLAWGTKIQGVTQDAISRPILPQHTRALHQTDRTAPLYPTVPQPPRHCHSLVRYTPTYTSSPSGVRHKTQGVTQYAISRSILPQHTRALHQTDRTVLLYPTVPQPPSHCHLLVRYTPTYTSSPSGVRHKTQGVTQDAISRLILPQSTPCTHRPPLA